MGKKSTLILALFLCLFLPLSGFATTIVLKSGKTAEGKYLNQTDESITIEIEGIALTYYFDQIETIDEHEIIEIISGRYCPDGLYTKTPITPPPYTGPRKAGTVGEPEDMPFYVYDDIGSAKNHFFPYGLMGDYGDLKYSQLYKENPYSGRTCIEIDYCACGFQYANWAGMYWQGPANNWGTIDAGYNLSKAKKLTFWARGAKGGEYITEFKVGGIINEFSDSDIASTGPVVLNKEWTQYTIDLERKDMSYIIGGFCWVANPDNNPKGIVFYLDEIKFE